MSVKLRELQNNQGGNHIFPFLWLHGEPEEVLRQEIAAIDACGIKGFCLESRPHPDFLGELWWRDVDVALDEAKKRGMTFWILDDAAFPTGYAAGRAKEAPEACRKRFIRQQHMDAVGPMKGAAIMVPADSQAPAGGNRQLLRATACRRDAQGEPLDLTGLVYGNTIYWDIPEGIYRVYFFFYQDYGQGLHTDEYINPLSAHGTQLLIDTVYEAHYERYAAEFGRTITGFFSDEPGIYCGYASDNRYYDHRWDPEYLLPWTEGLEHLLEEKSGLPLYALLPSLFERVSADTPWVREVFMDVVSGLYRDNFSYLIGDWCAAHGVEYIGHIIEDNNSHARIGMSAGHFFRSMEGQQLAGIDVVLNQILPGMDEIVHADSCGTGVNAQADGEFFAFALAQLGASQAQIEPRKQGRAMCEIFGAYGWSEGCKLMKWLTDFMLVRGINYFVPHAFSPKAFPDPDCPPHFYAGGNNPQYRGFQHLMPYMNRLAHLLSDGQHVADVAVLYHGEAEWSGEECMLTQEPARRLAQAQVSYVIVPADRLMDAVADENGVHIGAQTYRLLVVPYAAVLPASLLNQLYRLAQAGLQVVFIRTLPEKALGSDMTEDAAFWQQRFTVCGLDGLVDVCRAAGCDAADVGEPEKYLRFYHYRQEDSDVYMLFNEHPYRTITRMVSLPCTRGQALAYDALSNTIHPLECRDGRMALTLQPYESLVAVFTNDGRELRVEAEQAYTQLVELPELVWNVSICETAAYPDFMPYGCMERLKNLNVPGELDRFSGVIRYETTVTLRKPAPKMLLDLGEVYETAEVYVNGRFAGLRFAPPYRFELDGLLREGMNELMVEVRNTLGNKVRDDMSRFMVLEPTGLLGPLTLFAP